MADEAMEKQAVEKMMDRWINDPTFKEKLTTDAASALADCGIEASDEMIEAVSSIDANSSAEELQERVVKMGGFN